MGNCEQCGEEISNHKKYCDKQCYGKAISNKETSICEMCDSKFSHKPSTVGKYCSDDCRNNARKTSVVVECSNCSAKIERQPNQLERVDNVYCSKQCQAEGQKLDKIICEHCSVEFKPSYQSQKFCSRQCSAKSRESKVSTNCGECGEKLLRHNYYIQKYDRVFCSSECRSNWLQKHSLFVTDNPRKIDGKYSGFGSNWTFWRDKIRKRADGKCEYCGKSKEENGRALSVHHKEPRRKFIESDYKVVEDSNNSENLVALCRKCHMKAEHGKIIV